MPEPTLREPAADRKGVDLTLTIILGLARRTCSQHPETSKRRPALRLGGGRWRQSGPQRQISIERTDVPHRVLGAERAGASARAPGLQGRHRTERQACGHMRRHLTAMFFAAVFETGDDEGANRKCIVEMVDPPAKSTAGDRVVFQNWEDSPKEEISTQKKVWKATQPGFKTIDDLGIEFLPLAAGLVGQSARLVTDKGPPSWYPVQSAHSAIRNAHSGFLRPRLLLRLLQSIGKGHPAGGVYDGPKASSVSRLAEAALQGVPHKQPVHEPQFSDRLLRQNPPEREIKRTTLGPSDGLEKHDLSASVHVFRHKWPHRLTQDPFLGDGSQARTRALPPLIVRVALRKVLALVWRVPHLGAGRQRIDMLREVVEKRRPSLYAVHQLGPVPETSQDGVRQQCLRPHVQRPMQRVPALHLVFGGKEGAEPRAWHGSPRAEHPVGKDPTLREQRKHCGKRHAA
ncbi:Nucleic acid-binding, OB-fold protein [Cordyceps fumosorosea ARSEF 2679]|uniref:Nucleic acid-binding, OB-fold protein n=1 Tax=Cordyceps fumosorosea (strain ARSEF 2679) TaxID=1081104 RepID=A0A162HZH4_CORFA|nr:Nucleic acid-binding, OB-fold protein [Cordyceps fumosorosea ARSEF 2679]OAA50245.1 Nucleic acid-binding, OB-fold protein [Cordyceps fumosorosea ARSEF 2679]